MENGGFLMVDVGMKMEMCFKTETDSDINV